MLSSATTFQEMLQQLHACMQHQHREDDAIVRQATLQQRKVTKSRWTRLWYTDRKAAHKRVFNQHDSRESQVDIIPGVSHPLVGDTQHAGLALKALHLYHGIMATPAVPAVVTSPPWEDHVEVGVSYTVLSRGPSATPLYGALTEGLYRSSVRKLKIGKSPGPDSLPNELLQVFPAPMHALLHQIFKLSWKTATLPISWKSSFTKLFYKKGDPCHPSNYLPVCFLSDATTAIRCNFGQTSAIPVRRGTIQGDSLSPLLFIIFIEPLLRWLNVNDRGYRCHSVRGQWPHYANSFAVADDLGLASSSKLFMQTQLNKLTHYADWAGMVLKPRKCVANGALWNQAFMAQPIGCSESGNRLKGLLHDLTVAGKPLQINGLIHAAIQIPGCLVQHGPG